MKVDPRDPCRSTRDANSQRVVNEDGRRYGTPRSSASDKKLGRPRKVNMNGLNQATVPLAGINVTTAVTEQIKEFLPRRPLDERRVTAQYTHYLLKHALKVVEAEDGTPLKSTRFAQEISYSQFNYWAKNLPSKQVRRESKTMVRSRDLKSRA